MKIGVPREVKVQEYRVALTPAGVHALVQRGHQVFVEQGAGQGSGIPDDAYAREGATLVPRAEDVFAEAEMILKVKEPQPQEYPLLREGQILFTYLHLAASRELTQALLDRKIIGIAYETVEEDGELPLLAPMSEVAGRMAPQEGAKYLERPQGGLGILLGGIPGVAPAHVLILGGGTVGRNAALVAAGMGAQVTILEVDPRKIRHLSDIMPRNVQILYSTEYAIRELLPRADLVISAVLKPGARAPHLIRREHLGTMKEGAVIVDVAIDQGGSTETSRPTTHNEPVYTVEGVVHYCVANMPGAVPRTSTWGLTSATLPYVLRLADMGWPDAVREHEGLRRGVNLVEGRLTYPAVAQAFQMPYTPVEELIG